MLSAFCARYPHNSASSAHNGASNAWSGGVESHDLHWIQALHIMPNIMYNSHRTGDYSRGVIIYGKNGNIQMTSDGLAIG